MEICKLVNMEVLSSKKIYRQVDGKVWETLIKNIISGIPCDVEAGVLDCKIVVRQFELQTRYYFNFQINMAGKDIKPLITQL